jgi:hypothetical protein
VLITSGTLQYNAANTFSGGTIISSGAGLNFGGGAANAGTGGIVASNNTTIRQANAGSGSSGPGNTITTVDGAMVTLSSGTTANNYGGQFVGNATATNMFTGGNMSMGGVNSFTNFLGTVIVTNGTIRMGSGAGPFGGDKTTYIFLNGGGMFTRDAATVRLGALFGNGQITGPSVTPLGTYWIGAKGIDSEYSGTISGSNSIVKVGAARLTLDGAPFTVQTDGSTYTNNLYTGSTLTYLGNTTVSNGVLALSVPNLLNNSPNITLAGAGAVLDVANMGYVTNFNDLNSNPDSALVTNGLFELVAATPGGAPQTLTGIGTVRGSLLADSGSTLTIGLPLGSLTVTNKAELAGTVNMAVNATNTINASELLANNLTIDGTATLVVTNLGAQFAAKFQLFNHPVSFASVTLPPPTGTNSWINNLAVDGSITLVAPALVTVSTNAFSLTNSYGSGNLTLSWPLDHTGWRLLVQTNNLAAGLSVKTNDWATVSGSAVTNQVVVPVDPTNPTEFYRMVYP